MIYKEIARTCVCRCCGGYLEKEFDHAVFFDSQSSGGGQIILCVPCIQRMRQCVIDGRVAKGWDDFEDLEDKHRGEGWDDEKYDH